MKQVRPSQAEVRLRLLKTESTLPEQKQQINLMNEEMAKILNAEIKK